MQAFYLSDITTGDGLRLTEEAWNGQTITLAIRNESWLRKGRPQKKGLRILEITIEQTFPRQGDQIAVPIGGFMMFQLGDGILILPKRTCT